MWVELLLRRFDMDLQTVSYMQACRVCLQIHIGCEAYIFLRKNTRLRWIIQLICVILKLVLTRETIR
mgnify:CR=1 FL=1